MNTHHLELSEQINQMGLGDHICLIYRNMDDQMKALIPYMHQGLERNECCVYIVDDHTVEETRAGLKQGGIDVDLHEANGALTFATKRNAYLNSGEFDPSAMLVFLESAMEGALQKGFSGFRVTGEMTWALGSECGCDRLIEYEALLNRFFPDSKATAICQYNINRFSPEMIRDVLRTHPTAIIDSQVCPNIYYEAPELVLNEQSAETKLNWMIGQLKNFHKIHVDLKHAVQTRDEFLSIASHELKTPLTSLKLNSQNIGKKIENEALEPKFKGLLKRAMQSNSRQVDRLSKLVEDLLDVSQINYGKLNICKEEADLYEITEEVTTRFLESGANIELNADLMLSSVPADKFRIEQVIANLLTNAVKYGLGKKIIVNVSENDGHAEISVKDFGIGISEENKTKIFDRFERAVNRNEVSGMGLGLYISKEIIEAHGGSIIVESGKGSGSLFTMKLPLAD